CSAECRPNPDDFAPIAPPASTVRTRRPSRSYRVETAQADKYAGAWVTDAFRRHGVALAQDAEVKSVLYLRALPKFMARAVDLLALQKLGAQLAGLERRRRAGGRDVVAHPPGSHDDVANAVAGAVVQLARHRQRVERRLHLADGIEHDHLAVDVGHRG